MKPIYRNPVENKYTSRRPDLPFTDHLTYTMREWNLETVRQWHYHPSDPKDRIAFVHLMQQYAYSETVSDGSKAYFMPIEGHQSRDNPYKSLMIAPEMLEHLFPLPVTQTEIAA